jgi:hypothetical protein
MRTTVQTPQMFFYLFSLTLMVDCEKEMADQLGSVRETKVSTARSLIKRCNGFHPCEQN